MTKQLYAALVCRLTVSTRNPCNYIDYYSFTDPGEMEGWVGLVRWPTADTLPTKWSHVNHRSGIDRGKSANQIQRPNQWATPPTKSNHRWGGKNAAYLIRKSRQSQPSVIEKQIANQKQFISHSTNARMYSKVNEVPHINTKLCKYSG